MNSFDYLLKTAASITDKGIVWNQGPGGNLSLKEDQVLWIKASGLRFDQLKSKQELVPVEFNKLNKELQNIDLKDADSERHYSAAVKNSALSSPLRPSMEAGFHAALPQKYVFHFHALSAVLVCHHLLGQGDQFAKWLRRAVQDAGFADFHFVPALMPGLVLSVYLQAHSDKADIFFLQNHGVVIQSDDQQVLERFIMLENKIMNYLGSSWDLTKINSPGKLKLYFPDLVIMKSRIEKVIVPTQEGFYRLLDNASALDKDAVENWQATILLQQACPELVELPEDILGGVVNLPTELERLLQMKKENK